MFLNQGHIKLNKLDHTSLTVVSVLVVPGNNFKELNNDT